MRYFHVGVIAVLVFLVLLFMVQNLTAVTVSILGASLTLPIWLLVLAVYVLGALTGGFALALARSSLRRARTQR